MLNKNNTIDFESNQDYRDMVYSFGYSNLLIKESDTVNKARFLSNSDFSLIVETDSEIPDDSFSKLPPRAIINFNSLLNNAKEITNLKNNDKLTSYETLLILLASHNKILRDYNHDNRKFIKAFFKLISLDDLSQTKFSFTKFYNKSGNKMEKLIIDSKDLPLVLISIGEIEK